MSAPSNNALKQAAIEIAQPLLRARDLSAHGLATALLTRLVAAGKLERGVYGLLARAVSEHRSLAEVAMRIPNGAICLLSALRVHGIGKQAPFEVWMTIPPTTPTPHIDQPALRVVRMSGVSLTEGVEPLQIDGVQVRVFNAAKTVANCLKYRNKIGVDVALEALRDGWQQVKLPMDTLRHYATVNRVANVMRPYLESVTVSRNASAAPQNYKIHSC